jgi:hypothetical protein
MEERTLIVALTTLNLAVGISAAMILSRLFCPRRARTRLWVLAFLACLGMYFLECVAFTVGMATQVFVLSLAVVWGALVGWWSGHVERTQPLWPMAVSPPELRASESRAGGTRTHTCRIKSPVCCQLHHNPILGWAYAFVATWQHRVFLSCLRLSVVALRIELSTTRLSAVSGQPALDYLV